MTNTLAIYKNNMDQEVRIFIDRFDENLIQKNMVTNEFRKLNDWNSDMIQDIVMDVNTKYEFYFQTWFIENIKIYCNECYSENEPEYAATKNFLEKVSYVEEEKLSRKSFDIMKKLLEIQNLQKNFYEKSSGKTFRKNFYRLTKKLFEIGYVEKNFYMI